MNLQTDQLEYIEIDGQKEVSIIRTNLMNEQGYKPYCGENIPYMCSNPRTYYNPNSNQFKCPECGWVSQFPTDFIERYKAKWNK